MDVPSPAPTCPSPGHAARTTQALAERAQLGPSWDPGGTHSPPAPEPHTLFLVRKRGCEGPRVQGLGVRSLTAGLEPGPQAPTEATGAADVLVLTVVM